MKFAVTPPQHRQQRTYYCENNNRRQVICSGGQTCSILSFPLRFPFTKNSGEMVRATAIDPTEQITILRKYYYYRAADKALVVRNHVLVLTILRGAKVRDFCPIIS